MKHTLRWKLVNNSVESQRASGSKKGWNCTGKNLTLAKFNKLIKYIIIYHLMGFSAIKKACFIACVNSTKSEGRMFGTSFHSPSTSAKEYWITSSNNSAITTVTERRTSYRISGSWSQESSRTEATASTARTRWTRSAREPASVTLAKMGKLKPSYYSSISPILYSTTTVSLILELTCWSRATTASSRGIGTKKGTLELPAILSTWASWPITISI